MNANYIGEAAVAESLLSNQNGRLVQCTRLRYWVVEHRCKLTWSFLAILAGFTTISTLILYSTEITTIDQQINTVIPVSCNKIPIPDTRWSLNNLSPFLDIPAACNVSLGESLCVRVVVPAIHNNFSMLFTPFSNMPWDSIMLDFVGQDTGVSIPVNLQMVDNTQNYRRDQAQVYEADVMFRDADTYTPSGYIEYRNAEWNSKDHLHPQPMIPEPLLIPDNALVSVHKNNSSPYDLTNYLSLPLCIEPNADGRWVNTSHLPFNPSLIPPPDMNNRAWLPYTCRLRPYSYRRFAKCMKRKNSLVHWFGDSNTRRALKKIASMGSWCSDPEEINTPTCLCNDNAEDFPGQNTTLLTTSFNINNGFQIDMIRWGGLTALNNPPWINIFQSTISQQTSTPSVVIFGLLNWDIAFASQTFFAQEVNKLMDVVEQNYSAKTEIIIRTAQYYCCTNDKDAYWNRKFSRLRTQYFNAYITNAFVERFGQKHKVSIWDVTQISETRPLVLREKQIKLCAPNHVSPDIIDIENQMLINHLCN